MDACALPCHRTFCYPAPCRVAGLQLHLFLFAKAAPQHTNRDGARASLRSCGHMRSMQRIAPLGKQLADLFVRCWKSYALHAADVNNPPAALFSFSV
uniref:Uncharacterized protein n=1 Tax=Arundo donax TaxID=35708 RepID=A0A0A9BP95_ARUDO